VGDYAVPVGYSAPGSLLAAGAAPRENVHVFDAGTSRLRWKALAHSWTSACAPLALSRAFGVRPCVRPEGGRRPWATRFPDDEISGLAWDESADP
jgi:hypothetical protein